jgi:hypothetical protein
MAPVFQEVNEMTFTQEGTIHESKLLSLRVLYFLTSRGESSHFRLSKPVWPWILSVDEHVYFTITA